jgi:ferritin-like metal-binding protein YciE
VNRGDQKVVEYLRTAYAQELAITRTLQAHVEMAHSGAYRSDLQHHLTETVRHARLVRERLNEMGYLEPENILERAVGTMQSLVGQGMSLAMGPFHLLRGKGDIPETMLKNARDEAATEAMEIATYMALRKLAEEVGDNDTAALADTILKDEEAMLKKIGTHIPTLAEEVVRSQIVNAPTNIQKKKAS